MAGHDQIDPLRWVKRTIAAGAVVVGWFFIIWQNHFHLTPPTVFACIAYFALVATIYNLWRTGAAAVAPEDPESDDSTWGKPVGAMGELEREKRTLLKAIKEAEFDQQMGKLSKKDADELIAVYRARAIEVIKELEKLGRGGRVGTKREQIEREVRARLEVDKPVQRAEKKAKEAKGGKAAAKPTKGAIGGSSWNEDESSEAESSASKAESSTKADSSAKSTSDSADSDADASSAKADAKSATKADTSAKSTSDSAGSDSDASSKADGSRETATSDSKADPTSSSAKADVSTTEVST